jgi:hypothetical protein
MADEAFALSPISARATQPREEDYEAISNAFMETSRGRWFLSEYARRNRNADTSMVLDAMARLEENLAAQRQPASDSALAAALTAIRGAVDEASAAAALDVSTVQEALAPVRKGARVIREISWRWREIGADGRICDLIDSQVGAIEAGCEQIASSSPADALSAAFDLIRARIAEFDVGDPTFSPSAEAPVPSAPEESLPVALDADAEDDAVLDRIALEMAAADPDDSYDDIGEPPVAEPPRAAPESVGMPQPVAVSAPTPATSPPQSPSLGSVLIANAIVQRPRAPASDPLAPIRRMSQAEKIAFFS